MMSFEQIRILGFEVAGELELPLKSISRGSKARGHCTHDGQIFITMHTSSVMRDEVKDQENLRTLAHELAHLEHFHHGREFWDYASDICELLSMKVGYEVKAEVVMFR